MNIKTLLASAAALALASTANADLRITEVVDATLPGGQPKFVELTNNGGTAVDLSLYSFGNMNNGGTTLGGGAATVLTGMVAPGASHLIAYEADPGGPGLSNFFLAYGFDPDFYMGGGFVNGDDALLLYLGAAIGDGLNATIVDVYGVVGVDGSGQTWEYTDSYAIRCNSTANNGTFVESNWFIPGANTLEGSCGGDDVCELALLLTLTTPGVDVGCGGGGIGTPFCFGDGTSTACPCGNMGASGEGCSNSAGAGAILTGGGTIVASNDDLVLSGSQMPPGVPGLFFTGPNNISSGAGSIFGDGVRCAGGSLLRLEVVFADISGNANTTIGIASSLGATTGTQSYMQLWYRDPSGPCGGQFNTSNALDILWQ